ncbi:FadR family transcriptional regulator, partial [Enterobacter hormaechei]|nr:FadR family transcriptional regulator [Enterobacter hormaechei]
ITHPQPSEAAPAMREHLLTLHTALIQAIHLEDDSTL